MRKFIYYCPFCEKEHEIEFRIDQSEIELKGQNVIYDNEYYYCPLHPEESEGFVTAKMMDDNLLRARNAYRAQNGLMTSDEIVNIRKNYGLSQAELAKLLGWGGATIARYETKFIQDEAHDDILKQVRDNPMFVYKSLLKHKDVFNSERFCEIKTRLISLMEKNGYLGKELLESYYISYSEPSERNGFKVLDIDKLVACISYMASKIELHKTKLMKLLWYVDSVSYKTRGKAMTGLVYCHQSYGALPIGTIMELKDVIFETEVTDEGYETFRIYPNADVDLSVLSKDDIDVIDLVLDKLGNMTTKELVDYMHQEIAYTFTKPKEVISFGYAESLNDF